MTLALQTESDAPQPVEVLLHFLERVADWSDPVAVSTVAAAVLRERLAQPTVSIFGYDAEAQSVRLLAAAPQGNGGTAVGTRLPLRADALATALREGTVQQALNSYVEPDFVHSLPGDTRSELVVPMVRDGVVLGAIHLEYGSTHRPGADAQELAEHIALPLSAVLAIDAVRAAQPAVGQPERRVRQAQVLAAVAEQIAGSGAAAEAMQRVLRGARDLVPADSALLLLRHPERQMMEVAAVDGAALLTLGELVPLEGTLAGAVLTQSRPLSATGLGSGATRFCPTDAERGIRDALLVPIAAGGSLLGALALLNRAGGPTTPAEDVELLQSVAHQAGAVEVVRQMARLRQQISDASMIAEVGRAMTGTLGLEEVLALVVQAAQMLVNAQGAAVGMVSEAGDTLALVSTAGVLRRSQGLSIPVQGSLMGWAVAQGEAVITESISDDPRTFPHEVRQGPGVVVPLESRGQIRGALLAGRREGLPMPSEEDVDALRKLGAYAAIAIDNARLYQEQKELSRVLRAQAEELERAYAELAASQERLVVSEKMAALGRVTAGIAHEINSPLGSILNCLQLANGYAQEYQASITDPDVSPEDHLGIAGDLIDSLTLAEGAARRVAQFVRTIKSQTRMVEESIRGFDPGEEIENSVVLLQHELRNRNVTVNTEADPGLELVGDPGKFAVVVQNLLANAIDAFEGGGGKVDIRLHARGEQVVLEVEDHGCGIPDEIRPRIYDYLFTTKDVGQGTGLGLSMVHSIVTSHFKGTIDFRSEVGVGTTFIITFPATAQTV